MRRLTTDEAPNIKSPFMVKVPSAPTVPGLMVPLLCSPALPPSTVPTTKVPVPLRVPALLSPPPEGLENVAPLATETVPPAAKLTVPEEKLSEPDSMLTLPVLFSDALKLRFVLLAGVLFRVPALFSVPVPRKAEVAPPLLLKLMTPPTWLFSTLPA